jgi:hypothetical protein
LCPWEGIAPVPTPRAGEATVGSLNFERFYDNQAEGNGAVTLTTEGYQKRSRSGFESKR